jgi:pyruvate,water dikinase
MEKYNAVVPLNQSTLPLRREVGHKAYQLSQMMQAKLPIPSAFCLTTQAYEQFLEENNLTQPIKEILAHVNPNHNASLFDASREIKRLILEAKLPADTKAAVEKELVKLAAKKIDKVVVRSSAMIEDLPRSSMAGAFTSIIASSDKASVFKAIRSCYASLYNARSLYYFAKNKQPFSALKMAVIVQTLVKADRSGVMFTANPLSSDRDSTIIEAVWGLAESIVAGSLIPDHYEVNTNEWRLTRQEIAKQNLMLLPHEKGNKQAAVPAASVDKAKLTDPEIIALAKLGKKIESLFTYPQDIEWAFEKNECFLLQSRPITTLMPKDAKLEVIKPERSSYHLPEPLLIGIIASPGITSGKVVLVDEKTETIPENAVIVAKRLPPQLAPLLRMAKALISEQGGVSSHAAILSREFLLPTIIQANGATRKLKPGSLITVDATTGRVYEGKLPIEQLKLKLPAQKRNIRDIKTKTKLYLSLPEIELAHPYSHKYSEGVGVIRGEAILKGSILHHPMHVAAQQKNKYLVAKWTEGIETVAQSFYPRPVLYALSSSPSNHLRALVGGENHELTESNPALGLRGAAKILSKPRSIVHELKALEMAREKRGYKNIHLILPLVRTPHELKQLKKMLSGFQLNRRANLKHYLSIDTMNAVLLLDDFIDAGLDGIVVDTETLAQSILSIDPDNDMLEESYQKDLMGMQKALEIVVRTAKRRGIACLVTGAHLHLDKDLIDKVLSWGASSIAAEAAYLDGMRLETFEFEQKHAKPSAQEKKRTTSLSVFQRIFKK